MKYFPHCFCLSEKWERQRKRAGTQEDELIVINNRTNPFKFVYFSKCQQQSIHITRMISQKQLITKSIKILKKQSSCKDKNWIEAGRYHDTLTIGTHKRPNKTLLLRHIFLSFIKSEIFNLFVTSQGGFSRKLITGNHLICSDCKAVSSPIILARTNQKAPFLSSAFCDRIRKPIMAFSVCFAAHVFGNSLIEDFCLTS